MLDAEPAGDHGRHDDVGVAGKAVRAGPVRDLGRGQRGGDQPAVLATGQGQLDRHAPLAQRPDRVDQGVRDRAVRSVRDRAVRDRAVRSVHDRAVRSVRDRAVRDLAVRSVRAGAVALCRGRDRPAGGDRQLALGIQGPDAAERGRGAYRVAEAEEGGRHDRVRFGQPARHRGGPRGAVADQHRAGDLGQVDRVDPGHPGTRVQPVAVRPDRPGMRAVHRSVVARPAQQGTPPVFRLPPQGRGTGDRHDPGIGAGRRADQRRAPLAGGRADGEREVHAASAGAEQLEHRIRRRRVQVGSEQVAPGLAYTR